MKGAPSFSRIGIAFSSFASSASAVWVSRLLFASFVLTFHRLYAWSVQCGQGAPIAKFHSAGAFHSQCPRREGSWSCERLHSPHGHPSGRGGWGGGLQVSRQCCRGAAAAVAFAWETSTRWGTRGVSVRGSRDRAAAVAGGGMAPGVARACRTQQLKCPRVARTSKRCPPKQATPNVPEAKATSSPTECLRTGRRTGAGAERRRGASRKTDSVRRCRARRSHAASTSTHARAKHHPSLALRPEAT